MSGMSDEQGNLLLSPVTSIDQVSKPPAQAAPAPQMFAPGMDDDALLELFKKCKREAFDMRWVFERQWLRNIFYVLGRQWIYYNSKAGEWQDKRLARWIPRPTNPDLKNGVQAIRAMFASIELGMNVRPNGQDPRNITAAAAADELVPLLHDSMEMDAVMKQFDWWLIVTGNAFLYTFQEYDRKYGTIDENLFDCAQCGYTVPETKMEGALCPECGGPMQPGVDDNGDPKVKSHPKSQTVTRSLSPFEIAFPIHYPMWSEVPYTILMRWRTKSYYENNDTLAPQVQGIRWAKSPQDRSMQIFRSLPQHNDLGVNPFTFSSGTNGTQQEEGIAEYELHYKPCDLYPEGLVVRVIGDSDERILHNDEEAVPGPFPYKDAGGMPRSTIEHAGYEHVGGRILASGALDPVIQKLDQLNQLDSMIQMIIQRMANPVWLEPKGAEVEKFTGEPGLVVKWNPLTVQGGAKPERIAGEGPHGSFFTIREQYKRDIEEGLGTYNVIKGDAPTGIGTFSTLQLLVERAQSRFATAFKSRGGAYVGAMQSALELEREFGPDERTAAVLSPNRGYTFQSFKRANLFGAFTVVAEDGSNAPKTILGMRAAVEHLNQLGFINPADPDQKYKIFQMFGQGGLSPSLDSQVQSALQKQDAFEKWLQDKNAQLKSHQVMTQKVTAYQQQIAQMEPDPLTGAQPPIPPPPSPTTGTPLAWKPWYDPTIHRQEFLKWMNSDRMRQVLRETPAVEEFCIAHMNEINTAVAAEMVPTPAPSALGAAGGGKPAGPANGQPGGAGAAMNNSNRESTSPTNLGGGGGTINLGV